ncbi:FAD:protein FMN transferase [Microvirga massiliensis]|uniref:FAD:protein FMN transferase n=1 Tax=Microvirga massiliensis TaxID=1033741 RepID=UPI00062BF165|nr:FAD:protein FMN transferase [Microvirga massiliensis]
MAPLVSRRRLIGVSAAAAGLSLLPLGRVVRAEAHVVSWRGEAMGAVATLQIHHHDRVAAESLVERALAEVRRLERIFSLYQDGSALVSLNRQGFLVAPPPELVTVLRECRRYFEMTGGAFDPTVQALWTLYSDHFTRPGADPRGPSKEALQTALSRVGFGAVVFDENRVALGRHGVALTLNGIAQGFATDHVVNLLRSAGIAHSLVDMGETRAIGSRPDGSAWAIGIADPNEPLRVSETLRITDRAVATSGGYGFRFDPEGRFTHLFDPRTGLSPNRHASVTTITPTATEADALSTAFAILSQEEIEGVLRSLGRGKVHLTSTSGERRILSAA